MSKNNNYTKIFIILSIIGLIYSGLMFIINNNKKPIDKNNHELIEVSIPSGAKAASKALKNNGIIKSKTSFFIASQLNGSAGKIKPGTYNLSQDMDFNKIMSVISIGDINKKEAKKIRIAEGSTVDVIAETLFDNKIITDKDRFFQECNNIDNITNKTLQEGLDINDDRKYIVEGYLFPDTYEFYEDSNPKDVVQKMTSRFSELYNENLIRETVNKQYNVDIVLKLASIIEKEANNNDFNKVSAVLKNRMAKNMALQCDSTIRYICNEDNTILLNKKQYEMDSPYNSYRNHELPPSPICNPSLTAIKAVLNPDQGFINDEYLYFCSTENANKDLVFAKTYEEHLNNVKKYIGTWREYDKAVTEQ